MSKNLFSNLDSVPGIDGSRSIVSGNAGMNQGQNLVTSPSGPIFA